MCGDLQYTFLSYRVHKSKRQILLTFLPLLWAGGLIPGPIEGYLFGGYEAGFSAWFISRDRIPLIMYSSLAEISVPRCGACALLSGRVHSLQLPSLSASSNCVGSGRRQVSMIYIIVMVVRLMQFIICMHVLVD